MLLTNGHRYRCPVHLHFPETLASDDTVGQKLCEAGFTDVEVVGSGSERFARGTWNGETTDVELPAEINSSEVEDLTS